MRREGYSLEYVDVMIDLLESKIEGNAVTPSILSALQKRLDAIAAACRSDPAFAPYYPHMLELQTLIYGEGKQEEKALRFLKEAVRQTGSAKGLYSRLLRDYIVSHSRPASSASQLARYIPDTPEEASGPQSRGFFTFRKLKAGLATAIVLAVVAVGTLHFVPRAAALPILLVRHSEISQAKQTYDNLTAQYKACSSDLAQRQGTIDANNLVAVDAYNGDAKSCNAMLQRLHQAAEQYDRLTGAPNAQQPQQ